MDDGGDDEVDRRKRLIGERIRAVRSAKWRRMAIVWVWFAIADEEEEDDGDERGRVDRKVLSDLR
jgi:hypothetical protein